MVADEGGLQTSFRHAMRRMPAAVTVVTSADATRRHGMTATAVASLSLDPPSLVVCINRATLLHDIMHAGEHFCVNILREDHVEISAAFSGAAPPEARFSIGNWQTAPEGVHYLEDAQTSIICRKMSSVLHATHAIFVGEAVAVHFRETVTPLIYQNGSYCVGVALDQTVRDRACA